MVSDAAAQQAQVDLDQVNFDRNAMLLRQRHCFPGRIRPGALHARQRQEQARSPARAGAGAARQARRQSGHRRHRASAIPCRRRRRSTRRSASSITRSSRRRSPASVTGVPVDRAREISCGIDDGVLSRRYRSRLGRSKPQGDGADVCEARPARDHHSGHLSGRRMERSFNSSISPASGLEASRCSPAQNTTGNWVKVVQRIPMRVQLEGRHGRQRVAAARGKSASLSTSIRATRAAFRIS